MPKRKLVSADSRDAAADADKRKKITSDEVDTVEPSARANDDYTVGWICAISTEYVAAQAFLDERHDRPEYVSLNDNNDYTLGKIGKHNVVIAVLPDGEYGTASAATVARDMLHSFPNVRIGLLVGIGGGAPSQKHDIRLGDVVVSTPYDGKGGVFQYDFGKTIQGQSFRTTGFLNQPPTVLRTAMNGLKTQYEIEGHQLEAAINSILEKKARLRKKYKRPDPSSDRLYQPQVIHPSNCEASCEIACGDNRSDLISRPQRADDKDNPVIHYGLIASANQLMKDASVRDSLAAEMNVLCFEMEAAGLMNHFPCLVIRGICDYSDSHKNKEWQGYAAMVAAAYTKDLLCRITPNKVEAERRIGDVVSDIQQRVMEVSRDVKELISEKHSEERDAILKWLTPIDYTPQQSDYINRREEGTGRWLLDSTEFQAWLETSKQTMFCPGIPGAGKTIITAIVIDDLFTRFRTDTEIGIAYLYCDFRRQHEQKIEDMLANLLKQLVQKQTSIPEDVQILYDQYKDQPKRLSLDHILKKLHSVSACYSKVFILIDALDECQITDGCRTRLLSEMFKLQEKGSINIFSTSRPVQEILETFKESTSLEIRATDEDVQKYLTSHLKRLPSFVLDSSELQNEIKATISEAVDGMFLLAQLHMDSLAEQPTVGHVKRALRNLPKGLGGLDQTYGQAMTRIESQGGNYRELAKKVLSWVIHAKRTLSTAELQHAVAVEVGGLELDQEFIPSIEVTGSICAGLVTVDTQSDVVRLVHYTTQEYFDRTRMHWFPNAESDITAICVTYLSFNVFASGYCQTGNEFKERLRSNQLYEYVACNWGHHAREALTLPKEALDFLTCKAKVQSSTQVLMTPKQSWGFSLFIDGFPREMTGLHLAAYFGVREAVKALLSEQSVDSKDSHGRTSLWYAVTNRHEAASKLLLENGANLELKDFHDSTLLELAACNGDETVAKLLLEIGANPESSDIWGRTPLLVAAERDHEAVVKLLLENGANPESKDIQGQTPLLVAARLGHEAVIKLLLKKGANPGTSNELSHILLVWAARNGHETVAKLLLEKGANPESKDIRGQTPLLLAAEICHEAVVKLLLEKGANPDSSDRWGRTPLLLAVEMDCEKVVKLLLKKGANPDSNDNFGQTPLLLAAEMGCEKVVKLLLEKGANPESKGIRGRTPLLLAVKMGHKAIVKLLLENGANPDSSDREGQTPLLPAVKMGHKAIVKLLLENGANPESKDDIGRTPLSWAMRNGHEAVVELFLEKSAKKSENEA